MGNNFGRLRLILIGLSITLLLFCLVRQIFDFLGRLWLPIVFNFLQIIATIFACFAALQLRPKFFYVYFVWTPFWWGWNVFLICFYANVGSLDRTDNTIFNFGTKGRSWWWKNVPACQRTYNASLGTVVVDNCILDYYYVEIIQAGLHILLALIVFGLALIFFNRFKRKCHRTYGSLHRRPTRPHVTVELTNGDGTSQLDQPVGGGSSSSGYLNASYDHSPAHRPPPPPLSTATRIGNANIIQSNDVKYANGIGASNGYLHNGGGHVMQNYRRNSNRRKSSGGGGSGSVQRKARDRSRDRLCPPPPPPPPLPPMGCGDHHHQLNSSKRSRSLQMDGDRAGSSSSRRRSSSTEGSPLDDHHPPHRSRSDAAVLEHHSARPSSGRSSGSRRTSTYDKAPPPKLPSVADLNFAAPSTVYSYSAEPKRRELPPQSNGGNRRMPPMISPDESFSDAAGENNNIVVYRQKPPAIPPHPSILRPPEPPPNRHSLFSFDPKSNTLIRYHENLARSQETVLSGISSIDQLLAQNRSIGGALGEPSSLDVTSYDSGIPPSYNAPSVETTSRNSQSYSVFPPRPSNSTTNYASSNHLHKHEHYNNNNNNNKPSYSGFSNLQHYDSRYPTSNDFPDAKIYDEESEYLQPNSVLRNSMHAIDYASHTINPTSATTPSADTTIFESTPKDLTPSSTPRWSYDHDAFVEDGPAIPKINDKGLLV